MRDLELRVFCVAEGGQDVAVAAEDDGRDDCAGASELVC